jgi:hypothetical protein
MASYLTYWKPQRIDWDDPSREVLDHTAGNQLKKISRGDRLYIMSYRNGEFYLLGRILADAVVSQRQAARRLGRRPDQLYEADHHVIATPPAMRAVAIPFRETLESLRLASGRTGGRLRGSNSVQAFRVAVAEYPPGTFWPGVFSAVNPTHANAGSGTGTRISFVNKGLLVIFLGCLGG